MRFFLAFPKETRKELLLAGILVPILARNSRWFAWICLGATHFVSQNSGVTFGIHNRLMKIDVYWAVIGAFERGLNVAMLNPWEEARSHKYIVHPCAVIGFAGHDLRVPAFVQVSQQVFAQ